MYVSDATYGPRSATKRYSAPTEPAGIDGQLPVHLRQKSAADSKTGMNCGSGRMDFVFPSDQARRQLGGI